MTTLKAPQREVLRAGSINAPTLSPEAAGAAGGALARASNVLAEQVEATGQRIRQARVKSEVTSRLLSAQRQYNEFYVERSTQAGGFATLNEDSNAELRRIADASLEGLDDAEGQQMLSERMQDFVNRKQLQAGGESRRQEIHFADQQTKIALDQARSVMASTNDTREYSLIQDDAKAALDTQVAAGLYSQEAADAMWNKFQNETTVDAYQNLIRMSPEAAVTQLEGESIPEISPAQQNQLLGRANAEVKRIKSGQKEQLRDKVRDSVYALEHGKIPEDLETTMAAAKGTEFEVVLGTNKAFHAQMADFSRATFPAQTEVLHRLRAKEKMSGAEVKQMERLERIHSEQMTLAKDAPMDLAIETGIINEQAPIDLSNSEVLVSGLRNAAANYQTIRAHYGDKLAGPLLKSDVLLLQEQFRTSAPNQQAQMLGVMRQGLGAAMLPAMRQLKDKGSAVWALAGELAYDNAIDAARTMLAGVKANEKSDQYLPKKADLNEAISTSIGGAYSGNAEYHDAVIKGIKATYAGLAQLEGEIGTDNVNDDRLDRAIKLFHGGEMLEYRGKVIPAPKRGVDQDSFDDWVESISAKDVDRMGSPSGFSSATTAELIQDNELRYAGRGRYMVMLQGLGDMKYALKKNQNELFFVNYYSRASEDEVGK